MEPSVFVSSMTLPTRERRKFRGKKVETNPVQFERHRALMTILCIIFGAAFLCVALLSTIFGDSFVDAMFHSFGG
nr:hypothetical protein HUO10_003284 [Paraburkholderia busanensis]